jgi:site-specific DNA recombinase
MKSRFTDAERDFMPKAIIYARYSPRKDAKTCDSCEYQVKICFEAAEERGYDVIKVYEDKGVSGKDEFRPKLFEAIRALREGDALVVYKRDRIARNVLLAEQINRMVKKQGGSIIAASGDVDGDGPEAKMARQLMSVMSEYERELISMRTKTIMRIKQKEGRRMSRHPPYGWRLVEGSRMMVEVPEEQETVKTILDYADSIRAIRPGPVMRYMNQHHRDKARGKAGWNYRTIQRIMNRRDFVFADDENGED